MKPHRTSKHKSKIQKVMFLCAVARPRYDCNNNQMWDGKIGIWPFARLSPALRASINRPAGTLEWKPYAVTKDSYREMIIHRVIPAIELQWPQAYRNATIFLQHDNASSHFGNDDVLFQQRCAQSKLDMKIYFQPPNSPDLNVLDLGFFASLQAMVTKSKTRNKQLLIQAVHAKFASYPHQRLNNVFLTLQMVMSQVILCNGGNNYELQHMNKQQLERNGALPMLIAASDEVLAAITDDKEEE